MQEATPRPGTGGSSATLTKREQQVLELMALGLANKEIAERLGLGRRTVETHINHVLVKLDVSSRTRAVVEAGRAGLIGNASDRRPGSPLASRPNNLPLQSTTLMGREQDLIDVKILLEGTRLLTLAGSGGVGKTRLSLRVAADLIGLFPGGVWFCDFSLISGGALVPSVVALALSVHEDQHRSLVAGVVAWLRRKRALLIFDNCEHVIGAAAELAAEILRACPDIRILATSRQPLGIPAEVVHRVRSLTLPDEGAGLRADRAMRFGAVSLFVDRAMSSDSGFTLSDDNAPLVADICRRVDGIPLAIELAATRVTIVSLPQLAKSLEDRFRVLMADGRAALPRHKTLSALIDWSYDLLSAQEKTFFDRLGVFAGSFSAEAAQLLGAGHPLDGADLGDLLIALVDKSLVVAQAGEATDRYRLLESTRAYALHKLGQTEMWGVLRRRHAEYFRDTAQSFDARFGVGSTQTWLKTMAQDLENYRAALEWSLDGGHDVVTGAMIAGDLERMWALAGLSVEARRWIELALQLLPEAEFPTVAARLWRANARFSQGAAMRASTEKALALYRRVGDGRGEAQSLRMLAFSLLQTGKLAEANEAIADAIEAFRRHGDQVGVASCLSLQGLSAYVSRDFATGRSYYAQALSAYRGLGDEASTATVLGNFGELEFADGRPQRALELVNESLIIRSRGDEQTDLAIDFNNSAAYHIALGELDEARESARQALRWAQPEQNPWNLCTALQHLALLAALRGQGRLGAMLLGYVNKNLESLGLERQTTEKWVFERLTATLNEQLGDPEIAALAERGKAWSEDRALQEALSI